VGDGGGKGIELGNKLLALTERIGQLSYNALIATRGGSCLLGAPVGAQLRDFCLKFPLQQRKISGGGLHI
jgi:hypothetical protein